MAPPRPGRTTRDFPPCASFQISDVRFAPLGARVSGALPARGITGVSIDTRTLQDGDLFVALKGDNSDGHDYVRKAFEAGAAAAVVDEAHADALAGAGPLYVAKDTLVALEGLGRAARARSKARIVAVTGSVGKTTTKELLRCALASAGETHASAASYNNHWGVPLTLARLPGDAVFAVIEIGMNHPGEIEPLARLARPHAALVTTVGTAHLEAFANIEGIAAEKAAVFAGLEPGGIAILPGDLPTSPILRAAARTHAARVLTFGAADGCDYRLIEARLAQDATVVRASRAGAPILFKIRSPGRHFAMNALGVIAAAEALGCDPAVVACDLGLWQPPPGQ